MVLTKECIRTGRRPYAEALHQRYTEVIDDTAFLDTIATNAAAWYDQHLAPAAVARQIADEVLRI